MAETALPKAPGSSPHRLADVARAALAWWRDELASLLPAKTVHWLTDAGVRRLLVIPQDGAMRLELQDEPGQILAHVLAVGDAGVPTAAEAFLKQHGRDMRDVQLGIRLPAESFFTRQLVLPREVGRSLEAVALADLLIKTPFRQDDIHHSCSAQSAGDRILVTQTVIRRKYVDEAAAMLGLEPHRLAFVETTGSDDVLHRVRPNEAPAKSAWAVKAVLALAATALVLGAITVVMRYQQQQATLDDLETRTASARIRAQEVRTQLAAADQRFAVANQLRARKRDSVRLLQLWDELSRILPDTSWVSELRLSRGDKGALTVTISGFSSAAASLVGIVDGSPMFDAVALTAPIAIDPMEQRERFVLQASVNPPNQQKAER